MFSKFTTKVSFQFPKYFVKTIDEPRHKSNRLNRESLMYSNLPLENGKRTNISSLIITKVQILKSWYLRTRATVRKTVGSLY